MQQSSSLAKLAPALVALSAELQAVAKDKQNPHFKNTYATLDAITEYVRPLLAKHGLAIIQGGEATDGHVVTLTTTLLHTSGEWISTTLTLPLDKANAQGVGSAVTYGRRYSLGAILSLTTDEDDDGAAASKPAAQKPSAQRPPVRREQPPTPAAVGPLTRTTPLDFGKAWKGKTVASLTTKDLQFAMDPEQGRRHLPEKWAPVFAAELERRQDQAA